MIQNCNRRRSSLLVSIVILGIWFLILVWKRDNDYTIGFNDDARLTSAETFPGVKTHQPQSGGNQLPSRDVHNPSDALTEQRTEPEEIVNKIEATQRTRQQHLDDACSRLGEIRNFPPVSWETTVHFLTSDKFNFIFCFVPKVSCTTWKSIMSALYQLDKKAPKGRFLKMSEIGDARNVMRRWRSHARVMFAREPLERTLSAYLDKFVLGPERRGWERKFGSLMIKKYRNITEKFPLKEPVKFHEFIRFITDAGLNAKMTQQTDHWLPISRSSRPCQMNYDFIGHYETLKYDAPYVLERFNLTPFVTFPEVHESRSHDNLIKAYADVSPDLIYRLVDYYKMDYELFGYSSEEMLRIILNGR